MSAHPSVHLSVVLEIISSFRFTTSSKWQRKQGKWT